MIVQVSLLPPNPWKNTFSWMLHILVCIILVYTHLALSLSMYIYIYIWMDLHVHRLCQYSLISPWTCVLFSASSLSFLSTKVLSQPLPVVDLPMSLWYLFYHVLCMFFAQTVVEPEFEWPFPCFHWGPRAQCCRSFIHSWCHLNRSFSALQTFFAELI